MVIKADQNDEKQPHAEHSYSKPSWCRLAVIGAWTFEYHKPAVIHIISEIK